MASSSNNVPPTPASPVVETELERETRLAEEFEREARERDRQLLDATVREQEKARARWSYSSFWKEWKKMGSLEERE